MSLSTLALNVPHRVSETTPLATPPAAHCHLLFCAGECPFLCPAGQACPEADPDQAIPCPPDQYSFLGQDTCQPCPQGFRSDRQTLTYLIINLVLCIMNAWYVYVCVVCSCSDASSTPTPDLEDCQQSRDSRSEWGEGVHRVCHMTLAVSGERVYIECVT